MSARPSGRRQPSDRVLAAAVVLVIGARIATGSPGHAADLPLTSEQMTIHVVGNPP